jgi:hypothetical protein
LETRHQELVDLVVKETTDDRNQLAGWCEKAIAFGEGILRDFPQYAGTRNIRWFAPLAFKAYKRALRFCPTEEAERQNAEHQPGGVFQAERVLYNLRCLAEWCKAEDERSKPAESKRTSQRKRRRQPRREPIPLTEKQAEAVHLISEHKGDFAAAGKAAGKSRQAMAKLYKKAMKKLGRSAGPFNSPKTRRLPTDFRGQATLPAPMDEE